MAIKIEIDINRLTLNDIIDIESGNLRAVRSIIAKFAVDDNGNPLSDEAAALAAGSLNIFEARDVMEKIKETIEVVSVPPTKGARL